MPIYLHSAEKKYFQNISLLNQVDERALIFFFKWFISICNVSQIFNQFYIHAHSNENMRNDKSNNMSSKFTFNWLFWKYIFMPFPKSKYSYLKMNVTLHVMDTMQWSVGLIKFDLVYYITLIFEN